MRLMRAPFRAARLFSTTARAANEGGPAVTYSAFGRRNESDETMRARLLCTLPSPRSSTPSQLTLF